MICSDCHKEISESQCQPCFIDWCNGTLCQDCSLTHNKLCPDHRGTLTLTAILGDDDGVIAKATMNGKTYTVVQRLHEDGMGPYREWIWWDSDDNVELQEFGELGFKTIVFYYPVDEPVWSRA